MKYFIKQKVFSFKDKFNITNEQQETLYQVEGKVLSIKNKLSLLSPIGDELLKAEKKLFQVFAKYDIFHPDGDQIAQVQRRFSFFKPKFTVYAGNQELTIHGDFIAHSFYIVKEGREIASIKKKLFSFGDSYVIDIAEEVNQELYLFIVIIVDQILEEAEAKRNARD